MNAAIGIAVDFNGNVYVTGIISDNAFKIAPIPAAHPRAVPMLSPALLVLLALGMVGTALWVMPRRPLARH